MQIIHHQERPTGLPESEQTDSHKKGHTRRNVMASVAAAAAVGSAIGVPVAIGASHDKVPVSGRTIDPTTTPSATSLGDKSPNPTHSATSVPSNETPSSSITVSAPTTSETSPQAEPTDPNKVSAVEPVLMVASTPDQLYNQVVHNLDCLWTSKDEAVQQACLTRLVGDPKTHTQAAATYQLTLQRLNQQYLHESNPYASMTTVDYTLIDKEMGPDTARLVMKEADSTGSVDEVSRIFKHVTAADAGINSSNEMVWILDSSTVLSSNGK